MRLACPPALPIAERRDDIVAALRAHQCLILIGDTGSGKTTQLPKMCLEAGCGTRGLVGCTQPRRIAALSVADRVAEETGAPQAVGCKIRFHDQTSKDTRIKFMTDGVLLAETRSDRKLSQYDALIIDEAHERSLNIDFLLGYLKRLLPERPDLKLVISSATIDAERFSAHFDHAPIITVAGRGYPITTEYWADDADGAGDDASCVERAAAAARGLADRPPGDADGDILVFMPTERDINDTLDSLRDLADTCELLPLFGRLPAQAQRAVFRPSKKRKIIVATNVAETSITVPGIRIVVDTGLARIARYNPRTGTTSLRVEHISQASCEQRRGRCGRVGPGLCVRLYSEEDFNSREPFTPPEIRRANLAAVILQMADLRLGDPAAFPFVDPPPPAALKDGYRLLDELGAFDEGRRLNRRGRFMARLPLDPRMSRILLEAGEQNALAECVILAAALAIQDPRTRPPEQEGKADAAHRVFADKQSDFLTLLAIWKALFQNGEKIGNAQLSRFCKTNFLSWQRMREWLDVHEQITRILATQKPTSDHSSLLTPHSSLPAPYEAIHKSLAAGFLRGVCQRKEKNSYVAAGGREVALFPGSGLYGKGPDWALAAEFVETSQLFARTVAAIQPDWLEPLAGPLCKKHWSSPHWEKKSGRVMALERVTLFGLTIVAGRKVDYSRVGDKARAEAREIFIRDALVACDLDAREFPFLAHNQALRERMEELEDRLRRRGIVADEAAMFDFYAARLGEACDRTSLKKLIRDAGGDAFLRMSEADLCRDSPDADELYRYPATLESGGMNIPLAYHFAPGEEDDGVTAQVTARQLPDLNPQPFEWLVPGLLPEKVLQLCKRLPKRLRRLLVPLPEAVERILDDLQLYRGSLYQELERVILRQYRVAVAREDWQADTLPPHLKMRFVLRDEAGNILAQSRSLAELQRAQAAGPTKAKEAPALPASREIGPEALDAIETVVTVASGPGKPEFLAHAALRLTKSGKVELCWTTDKAGSRVETREALRALLLSGFSREAAALRKQCKDLIAAQSASWLSLGAAGGASALQARLFAFAADAVFALDMNAIPGRAAFDAAVGRVQREGLLRLAAPVLDQVAQALRERREVLGRINQWASRAKQARCFDAARFEEYQHNLNRILPAAFLEEPEAARLRDRLRYLKALALRIERAEHDPGKDAAKAQRLRIPEQRLTEAARLVERAASAPACRECVREYEMLVEEFRIAVFAPELGTKKGLSEKRLEEKWAEVVSMCRRVE